jgi:hypothetical protein
VVGEFRGALDHWLRLDDPDVSPNAPADDAVLLLARAGGEHSFGHGPLGAPAGIPRMNLHGLLELARSRLG